MIRPAALIFAAGLGTRMGHLTQDRPKPIIEAAGRPLIDHALSLLDTAGIDRIAVNLHYKPQMLRDHLAHRDILFSDETETLLDTGGGLRHALPLLPTNPVLTLNSDAVWQGPDPVTPLLDAWRDGMEALVLCVPPANAIGHTGEGDFLIDAAGRVTRGPGPIYTGLQLIRTDRLAEIPDTAFSLNRLWDRMIEAGTLHGLLWPGKWCDVGQPASLPLAHSLLSETPDV